MAGSPGAPVVGVLAIQGDVREHLAALAACDVATVRVRRPAELDDVDALVIPGGESTTMDSLIRTFDLRDPLLKRLRDGMPAYGSCAGMILLADRITDAAQGQQTLGGIDMSVRRNAFGRQVASFETDLDLLGIDGPPLRAVFIRAPWVEKVADRVQVLARVPGRPEAGADGGVGADGAPDGRIVAVRQDTLLATSFHPEITGDIRVHRYFVEMVRNAR